MICGRQWRKAGQALAGLLLAVTLVPAAAVAKPVHLPALERALRAELEAVRLERQFPGATAAYVLADGRRGSVAVGLGDQELGLPMRPDSRMPAGSIGKTFVAALALLLVADGRLSLDDPLSRWLGDEPWFARLPNAADIRIRHLLNHSAGIAEHVESQGFADLVRERVLHDPATVIEPRELVAFVLDAPALFPAGQGYKYTDTGYILLQLAIEKAGGFELMDEVVRRFLYPLQLTATSPASGELHPGVVQGYIDTRAMPGLPTTTLDGGVFRWNPLSEWAGGGFISSSLDLAQWASLLYQGQTVPPGLGATMVADATLNRAPEGFAYGLGVVVQQTDGLRIWGHSGTYPGYLSNIAYFPDCRVAIAVQVNTDRMPRAAVGALGRALGRIVLAQSGCRVAAAGAAK